jgi:hypothetical protein
MLDLQPVAFEYSSSSKNGEGQIPLPALIDMTMSATGDDLAMKSQMWKRSCRPGQVFWLFCS